MTALELLKHYAFKCAKMGKFNRFTLKTRDQNICRNYCAMTGFNTRFYYGVSMKFNNNKKNCGMCEKGKPGKLGHIMSLQCNSHVVHTNFIYSRNKTMDVHVSDVVDMNLEKCGINTQLACFNCKLLPTVPRMCRNCRKCILCLKCARKNLIRHNQCPECCVAFPSFGDVPRNFQEFYDNIEVQCEKCVNFHIEQLLTNPNYRKNLFKNDVIFDSVRYK